MFFRHTRIAAFLFAFVLASAHADAAHDWHLVLHAHSWHASHPPGTRWNEENWGLGLRRELGPDWAWQVGAYRDSVNAPATKRFAL